MQRYYRQNLRSPREPTVAQTTQALVDTRLAPGLSPYYATKQEKETRRIENKTRNNVERKRIRQEEPITKNTTVTKFWVHDCDAITSFKMLSFSWHEQCIYL